MTYWLYNGICVSIPDIFFLSFRLYLQIIRYVLKMHSFFISCAYIYILLTMLRQVYTKQKIEFKSWLWIETYPWNIHLRHDPEGYLDPYKFCFIWRKQNFKSHLLCTCVCTIRHPQFCKKKFFFFKNSFFLWLKKSKTLKFLIFVIY